MRNLILVLIFGSLCSVGFGANILFYIGISGPSHQIAAWPLIQRLGERGHKVTLFSIFPLNNETTPNIDQFAPTEFKEFLQNFQLQSGEAYQSQIEGYNEYYLWTTMWGDALSLCELIIKSPETQSWIRKSKFDLVIMDVCANECGIGFAHKFNAPFMIFNPMNFIPWEHEAEGIIAEPHTVPDMQFHYYRAMTFYQRLITTLRPIYWYYYRKYVYFPKLDDILKKHLDSPQMPPMIDLEKNSSLLLLNSHFSSEFSRSLPPYVVSIGGMNCKEPTGKLPKDLKTFLDTKEGFIYLSFGSFVKFKDLPEDIFQTFLSFIGSMKHLNFLWKYENEFTGEKPKNLYISKWFPQQEILGHPKIKLFITQGGKSSVNEASFHGVPIVSIPFLGDQFFNTEPSISGGYGLRLSIVGINLEKLTNSVNTILNNPSYKEKAQIVAKLAKDRPMHPIDTGVWWTEYILRNKGHLENMKPLGYRLDWFHRRVLDVWAFIFISISAVLFICLFILKKIISLIFKSSESEPRNTPRKNGPSKKNQ